MCAGEAQEAEAGGGRERLHVQVQSYFLYSPSALSSAGSSSVARVCQEINTGHSLGTTFVPESQHHRGHTLVGQNEILLLKSSPYLFRSLASPKSFFPSFTRSFFFSLLENTVCTGCIVMCNINVT